MNRITFLPTQADYVAASRANYMNQWTTWRGRTRLLTIGFAVIIVMAVIDYWTTGRIDPFWPAWLAFVIVMLPVGVAVNLWLIPRRTRRQFAQQPGFAEPMTVSWSGTGFAIESPMTTHRIDWPRLVRWRESSETLLLYVTESGCLFVPKRIFSPEELATFRRDLGAAPAGR